MILGQILLNMAAILKFKMVAEDVFEKKKKEPTQVLFARVFRSQKALFPLV